MAHTEAHIEFSTLSNATTATDGTGNFDKLMKVVTLHVEAQFNAGRITGTDYATVYLGALQSTLAQAVNFTLNMNKANNEADLLAQKEITEYAQTGTTAANTLPVSGSVTGKQITLFTEQAKGFKWNAENKYLKALLDAYAINVSVSKEDDTDTPMLQGGSANTSIRGVIDDMKPTG
tara:strand:- start:239 stop:769 length:531 start_codon:yes stop_codon:yes gene_type:complete